MRKTIAAIVTLGTVSSMLASTVYAATNTTNAASTGNTANTTANATSNTTGSAPTNPNVLTQKSAVYQLIEVFNTIPSWPTGLQSIDPATQNAQWDWKYKPIPPSQWVGLACVFPGDPESKYAADLDIQMTDPNGPVTAGQLAQWIVDWEIKARRVNMAWEPSQDPYTLLQDFSFFYGTDVKGPNSVLTQKDMMAIRNNIVEVSRGWRQLGSNRVELLAPLVDAEYSVSAAFRGLARPGYEFKMSQWPSVYLQLIKTVDSQNYTFLSNGNVVYRYTRGTGYTPNINGVFLDSNQHAYSAYSFSDSIAVKAYQTNNPSLQEQAFYEPDYQVFSPYEHKVSAYDSSVGFVSPKVGEWCFESATTITDPYNARQGGWVASGLTFEFLYSKGKLQRVVQLQAAGLNYPSEVMQYG